MNLKILSFSGESFNSENVISVTVSTWNWEITILDNHSPLLTSIIPSTMHVVYIDNNKTKKSENFATWKWVLEVSENDVKVMADMLVDVESVDKDAAERAREKALEIMEKYKNAKDKVDMEKYIEAEDMLLKSIAQLKLSDTLR